MSTILMVIDFGQTLDIAEKPEKYYETNRILGRHPSRGEVIEYFAAAWIGKTIVANLLWGKWREAFLTGNIVISGSMVHRNYKIDLRINF